MSHTVPRHVFMLLASQSAAPIPTDILLTIIGLFIFIAARYGRGNSKKKILWLVVLAGAFYGLNALFGHVSELSEDAQKTLAIGLGLAVAIAAVLLVIGVVRIAVLNMRRGSLSGTVVEQAGNPVCGAAVSVKHSEMVSRVRSHTDARGEFLFKRLIAGEHRVTVEAAGFQPSVLENFQVEQGRTNSIRVTLCP